MTEAFFIDLPPFGGNKLTVPLGDAVISLVTKFNYSAKCWSMDIYDADDKALLYGLMLVPNIDLLRPYQRVAEKIGNLFVVETTAGAYRRPEALGGDVHLLWIPKQDHVP